MANFFGFFYKRRPDINEQNTGHMVLEQSAGYAPVAYTGIGGIHVLRSMNATNPASIVPGNSLKLNDPTVTGNNSTGPKLNPLSKSNLNADMEAGLLSANVRSF